MMPGFLTNSGSSRRSRRRRSGVIMRFPCSLTRMTDGRWIARHNGREVGPVEVRAASREEAISKLEGEIRYRLELCPCTGETYQHLKVEVVEETGGRRQGTEDRGQ